MDTGKVCILDIDMQVIELYFTIFIYCNNIYTILDGLVVTVLAFYHCGLGLIPGGNKWSTEFDWSCQKGFSVGSPVFLPSPQISSCQQSCVVNIDYDRSKCEQNSWKRPHGKWWFWRYIFVLYIFCEVNGNLIRKMQIFLLGTHLSLIFPSH